MNSDPNTRRHFLRQVGKGMLIASVGSAAAEELGLSEPSASEVALGRITFGKLEPLASLLQETPTEKLQPLLVGKLKKGEVDLRGLVQAAALSNARSFGGEDYIGMHTLMALKPAYLMSQQLPEDRKALAVLKVLYRNTNQINAKGGPAKEVLKPVLPADGPLRTNSAAQLQEAVHAMDTATAERIFARRVQGSPEGAFNDLLHVVEDNTDVHRVVFAHRSWDILDIAGIEHAQTMLRQSLRYCLKGEEWSKKQPAARELLPKMFDEHKLLGREFGTSVPDDAWVEEMSCTLFESTGEQAAGAVASALAEGVAPDVVGEAISLAANQLVLRDAGRTEKMVQPGKPVGSVHGDSIGVHASDSAHAWRHIAKVSNTRNAFACLVLAGYQVARDRVNRGGDFLDWKPRPHDEHLGKIKSKTGKGLMRDLDGAIREQDQAMACAYLHRYGSLGHDAGAVSDLLLGYATKVDGALHAEKYFMTTTSDFASTRPAYRWRHLAALARVTASEAGQQAPGYAEACELLGIAAS